MSGHEKKSTDRGALTSWRRQREQLVRTPKEFDRPRRTHSLETAEGSTCQNTERIRPTEAHSHTGDGRGSNLSGHRKKSTDRGALTLWRRQREQHVRTPKEIDRLRRTHKLETAEEQLVRTPKEIDRPRHTHKLETAEGATCQDTKRNRPTEAHSHTGNGRGSNLSGHRKKLIGRGALTPWRREKV